jgi:uncharacterized protein (DUF433 family)
MSRVVSLRLKDEQVERLERAARRLGRTPSETAALLLEESLRQREFAFIEFRDSPVGRQAYLQGTRLAVWQAVSLLRAFGGDVAATAAHLEMPAVMIAAALAYAEAHSTEIEAAIADQAQAGAELGRLIPNLEIVAIDAAAP